MNIDIIVKKMIQQDQIPLLVSLLHYWATLTSLTTYTQ